MIGHGARRRPPASDEEGLDIQAPVTPGKHRWGCGTEGKRPSSHHPARGDPQVPPPPPVIGPGLPNRASAFSSACRFAQQVQEALGPAPAGGEPPQQGSHGPCLSQARSCPQPQLPSVTCPDPGPSRTAMPEGRPHLAHGEGQLGQWGLDHTKPPRAASQRAGTGA